MEVSSGTRTSASVLRNTEPRCLPHEFSVSVKLTFGSRIKEDVENLVVRNKLGLKAG